MAADRRDNLGPDLSAYLDGELPEERAREIERLLAEQPEYREQLEQLRAVSDQLSRLPRHRAPDELTAAMRRHAERRQLLDEAPRPRSGRVLRLFVRLTAVAAAVALCVLVGYRISDREQSQPAVQLAERHPPEAKSMAAGRHAEPEVSRLDAVESPASVAATSGKKVVLSNEERMRLQSLGYIGGVSDDADESSLAMADVAAASPAGPAGMIEEPESIVVAGEPTELRPIVVSQYGYPPDVDVQIAPANAEQYAAARAILVQAGWQPDEPSRGGAAIGGFSGPKSAEMVPVQLVRKADANEVATLITKLEHNAPATLHYDLKGASADVLRKLEATPTEAGGAQDAWASREMLSVTLQPAAVPADAEDAARSRVAGVGGMHGEEQTASAEAEQAGEKEQRESPTSRRSREKQIARRPKADESAEMSRAGGAGGRRGVAGGAGAPASRSQTRAPRDKLRRIEGEEQPAYMGIPMPETEAAAEQKDEGTKAAAAPPPRGHEVVKTIVDGLKRFARALPPAKNITLRVTLLPPSAATTTQPADSPATQP